MAETATTSEQQNTITNRFISTGDCATYLGKSVDFVRRLIRDRNLPTKMLGRSILVEKQAFFDLVENAKSY